MNSGFTLLFCAQWHFDYLIVIDLDTVLHLVGDAQKILTNLMLSGQLLLAKGEVDQASAAFKIVLDGDRDNVPALLGQVYHFLLK